MSELRTNRIVPRDGLPSGTFGGIIQVVQTVKQTAQEITYAGGEQDVMSATINLKHASSKVMVTYSLGLGRGGDDYGYIKLFEGGSEVTAAHGTSGTSPSLNALGSISNRGAGNDQYLVSHVSGTFVHTPSSTSPTMKIRAACTYGTHIFINRPADGGNVAHNIYTASFLQLYELAG